MLTTANQKPISVGILEISSQNKAILEFFFTNAGKKMFKEVSLEKASAFIIDYDSVGAKSSWEAIFKETQKPGIIISIKEVDLPSCIWLPKPLTVQALTEAGDSIKEMILQREKEAEQLFAAPAELASLSTTQETTKEFTPIQLEEKTEIKELELVTAEVETTTAVESNSNFAVSPKLIDIDLTPKKSDSSSTVAKKQSLTKSVTTPDSAAGSSEIDELLESLISGEKNTEKVNDLLSDFSDESTDKSTIENKETINEVNKDQPIKDEISLMSPEISDLELKTVTKEKVAETNEIDIIDSKLEAAPPEKLEPITTDITNDGLSINLQEDVEDDLERDKEISFSATKAETATAVKSNDEVDKLVADIMPTTKHPKKTSEDELQSLLEEIRREANDSKKQDETMGQPTIAEERWMLTCGDNEDTDNIKDLCTLTLSNHMIATLLETIEKANLSKKVLRLKIEKTIIVIEPTSDQIYCEPSIYSKDYADVCYEQVDKNKIKIHELDTSEVRLYRKKMLSDKENTHTFEAFIWTTSLLTSRGRLPVNTDLNQNIGLKYWPNITRVEKTPHMMQIAAIFHKKTTSLQKASMELGIPQKFIFAFYNAALSLDIIKNTGEFDDSSTKINEEANKNKSFFSRLLKRISS